MLAENSRCKLHARLWHQNWGFRGTRVVNVLKARPTRRKHPRAHVWRLDRGKREATRWNPGATRHKWAFNGYLSFLRIGTRIKTSEMSRFIDECWGSFSVEFVLEFRGSLQHFLLGRCCCVWGCWPVSFVVWIGSNRSQVPRRGY